MVISMDKVAVVLSGGGSKGAYQAGVWRALRQLRISYDIVTGTSIGALNGMMMVQKDYFRCLHFWKHVTYKDLYDIEDETPFKENTYQTYAKKVISGGMDTKKMQKLLENYFRKDVFFKSPIDYGNVVYNVTMKKHEYVKKKEANPEKMADYILASASCYPAFKQKEIDGNKYIDGGIYDNLPINLAIELGAKKIIAVDLKAPGFKQKVKENVEIISISPRNRIVPFLVFEAKECKRTLRLGYNDTMKVFGKLDGDKYTFMRNHLNRNIKRYKKVFVNKVTTLLNTENKSLMDQVIHLAAFNRVLNQKDKEIDKVINQTIEFLGKSFRLDESCVYPIHRFNRILIKKIEKMDSVSVQSIEKKIKNKDLKELVNSQVIIKYLYDLMINEAMLVRKPNLLATLGTLFPKEFLAAVYLNVIEYI